MSARAAWRLESLGFGQVYQYAAGKADWFAAGLPSEGNAAGVPRAAGAARRQVPTCRLADRVSAVAARVRGADWKMCIVTNDEGIVLGRLRARVLMANADASAEEVMEAGPTTIRPHERLESVVPRLRSRHVDSILVTDSDGRLIGVLYFEEAERILGEQGLGRGEEEAACACND